MKLAEIKKILNCNDSVCTTKEINTLLTDSRSLAEAETSLFFAIRGTGNDGHRYMRQLYNSGVRAFVANHIPDDMGDANDAEIIIVPDTVSALQTIATSIRNQFQAKVIAITGSHGKTTLKEWLFELLEPLTDVARSPRSYNSQIGVPLSLWELDASSKIAIIEAGVSRRGEMKILRDCIQPNLVIATVVDDEHNEGFSSLEEKAAEKLLLAEGDSTTSLIYDADCVPLAEAVSKMLHRPELILGWSRTDTNAPLFIERYGESDNKEQTRDYRYLWQGHEYFLKAPGMTDADLSNTASALATMLILGYEPELIRNRFATIHSSGTGLNVSEGVNGCSLIYDSFTSDLSSLRPTLDILRRRCAADQSMTVILSDLRHESAGTMNPYRAAADEVRKAGVARFIGIGKKLKEFSYFFPEGSIFFEDTDAFMSSLSPSDFENEAILIKGAPEYKFDRILQLLETRTHETVLEVNLDALTRNYNYFRQSVPPGTGIICMVKASGYGAGSREIAKTLQDCGASYLAVAVLDEGIDLRKSGITMPIMVMNPRVANYKAMFANRLEPEIYSMEMLDDVCREARKNSIKDYPIHIKLDTGMHRMGFIKDELPGLMERINAQSEVKICSVFSHLATADCTDMDDYTQLQLSRFAAYTDYMRSCYPHKFMRHILNSAGILRFPEAHYDMVRLGIGLYGANTLPPEIERPLAVVSTLRTVIISIREWEAGETIGYGRKGVLKRRSRIATIPIGYADGMNRLFGNGRIAVSINGRQAPTVGNICMDACMIDVTDIDCAVGNNVEIFGENATLQRLADAAGTIPYEILTAVSPRVKRIYVRK